jgi:hypothetical protein
MISRKFLTLFSMLFLAQVAWAQKSDDIPGPAICASQEALECSPVAGCSRVSLASIDGPQFISLKPGEPRLIVTLANGDIKTAKVERHEKLDGKFIYQGSEEANPEADDGVGWTLLISEDTGRMVVTLAGADTAFVIFGACTLL